MLSAFVAMFEANASFVVDALSFVQALVSEDPPWTLVGPANCSCQSRDFSVLSFIEVISFQRPKLLVARD